MRAWGFALSGLGVGLFSEGFVNMGVDDDADVGVGVGVCDAGGAGQL